MDTTNKKSSDQDWFTDMDVECDVKEEHSSPVNEKLAAMANKRFDKSQSYDRIKTLQEQYKTPENCAKVIEPRVNSEIWIKLKQKM